MSGLEREYKNFDYYFQSEEYQCPTVPSSQSFLTPDRPWKPSPPIVQASCFGCNATVSGLVAEGADVNETDSRGRTAVWWAADAGNKFNVETLICAGADVNRADDVGLTPLHWAASRCDLEMATMLLDAGANPHAITGDGLSVLHFAVRNLMMDPDPGRMVKLLVDHGARFDVVNETGISELVKVLHHGRARLSFPFLIDDE